MDTISRENNSMLPVGAIIVGVIALLLGGYAVITLSKVNKAIEAHDTKLARVEAIESSASAAAAAADKAAKDVQGLTRSTQDAFNQVGGELGNLRGSITKLEEAAKKPVVAASKDGKKSSGPAVAGPDEYIVKPGDGGTKIAKAAGVSLADLTAVNPGVEWTKLKPGQKLKLPAKK
jgi:LysM repeat protein